MPRFTRDFGALMVSRGFEMKPNVGRVACAAGATLWKGQGRDEIQRVGRVASVLMKSDFIYGRDTLGFIGEST